MRNLFKSLTVTILLLAGSVFSAAGEGIDRIEPPFWWVGMKNNSLQLLVHGEGIGKADVSLKRKDIKLKGVTRVESPNYLFVDLEISPKAKAGSFDITFNLDGQKTVKAYELKERSKEPGAMGFSPKDVLYLITPDRFANGKPQLSLHLSL